MSLRGILRGFLLTAAACGIAVEIAAQPRPPAPPANAREGALFDLTGQWVAIVTEDWHFRMLTPAKGDYTSVPLNETGRAAADAWDPAGEDGCKAFGPPGGIRQPGRLRIGWENDDTLRVDFDAGEQTRLLRFGAATASSSEPTLQGHSVARWHKEQQRRGFGRAPAGPGGTLAVETQAMTAGYLRTNGVPYSADTALTEYFDVIEAPNGDDWLVVTSIVDDPMYLRQPFVISTNFRRESDRSKWNPVTCER